MENPFLFIWSLAFCIDGVRSVRFHLYFAMLGIGLPGAWRGERDTMYLHHVFSRLYLQYLLFC